MSNKFSWLGKPGDYDRDLIDFPDKDISIARILQKAALVDWYLLQAFSNKILAGQPRAVKTLPTFYSQFPIPCRVLSANIINNTLLALGDACSLGFHGLPQITYVVAAYRINTQKLSQTLLSIKSQVGVHAKIIIVVDGCKKTYRNVKAAISNASTDMITTIISREENGGLGKARNTGMKEIQTEFFSFLDPHDVIHPLRSLHAILTMIRSESERINTSYSRFELATGKIFLCDGKVSKTGSVSFIARTSTIEKYGYLLDLRYHEDTEYMQRISFFGGEQVMTGVSAHYLDFCPNSNHLSSDTHDNISMIENDPEYAGIYTTKLSYRRRKLNGVCLDKYEEILRKVAIDEFPCIE